MSEAIIGFLRDRIGNGYLLSALASLLPITEIKGSLLYAAAVGLHPILAFLAAYASSLLLILLLSALCPALLEWVEKFPRVKRLSRFLTDRMEEKADRIAHKAEERGRTKSGRIFGLFLFVALPLPLTGVWAGALLGALLHLDRKSEFFALAAGNFTAGGIVLAVALIAGKRAGMVLDAFLIVAAALILLIAGKTLLKRRKEKRA